jgi:adenylosuccinate lyase
LEDWNNLSFIRRNLSGKGFKGAVGTSAAYADLISVDQLAVFESRLSESLGLPFYPIASQVYPRKQDYTLLCALAGIGASLSKFALDIRILQSPPVGEWAEPFGEKQVGSSAMPFKRNPIQSEKIGSLARVLAQMPRTAWDNASNSILERTLDDSANRRIILPEAFLVTDELLSVATRLITKMQINLNAINNTLNIYAPFAATEHILMALAKAGADRQEMHAVLRQHALTAWQAVQTGMPNPLKDLICQDAMITSYIPAVTLVGLLDITRHTGDAPQRARKFAQTILTAIG